MGQGSVLEYRVACESWSRDRAREAMLTRASSACRVQSPSVTTRFSAHSSTEPSTTSKAPNG